MAGTGRVAGAATTDPSPTSTDTDPLVAIDIDEFVAATSLEASAELDRLVSEYGSQYFARAPIHRERVSVVGTASYQHTLMRVRTMSEPALGNRVKAIERAKGKHAVVKMKLFARVLFLEGYEELSTLATESLERLVAELGDPDVDGEDGDAE